MYKTRNEIVLSRVNNYPLDSAVSSVIICNWYIFVVYGIGGQGGRNGLIYTTKISSTSVFSPE